MQIHKNKNQLLIIALAVGFLFGVIYENIISKQQILTTELFTKNNLQRYLQTDIVTEKYLWYVIKGRVFSLASICILSFMKWKKTFVICCLLLIGFFLGVFSVASVLQLGIKGILLCFAGLFPHAICYIIAYSILFVYWYQSPTRNWNRAKTIFVTSSFLVGMLLEVYVNPSILKLVIQIL